MLLFIFFYGRIVKCFPFYNVLPKGHVINEGRIFKCSFLVNWSERARANHTFRELEPTVSANRMFEGNLRGNKTRFSENPSGLKSSFLRVSQEVPLHFGALLINFVKITLYLGMSCTTFNHTRLTFMI